MVYLYLLFYFIFSTNQKYNSTDLKDDLEFNNIVSDVKILIGKYQNCNKDIIKLQILSICTAAQTDIEYTKKKVNEILEMSKDIKEIDFIKNIIKDLDEYDAIKARCFAVDYLNALSDCCKKKLDKEILKKSAKNF